MRRSVISSVILVGALAIAAAYAVSRVAGAEREQLARGKYLVQLAGCTDCHTPGHFLGRPDMTRYLAGSDVGLEVPDLGVFVGPNLTPDHETGLGLWTRQEIATAFQTGVRPDGRSLAPIMPWRAYAAMTKSDAAAVVEYLKNLPPVSNRVPGPFGPSEKAGIFRMKMLPPDPESGATAK